MPGSAWRHALSHISIHDTAMRPKRTGTYMLSARSSHTASGATTMLAKSATAPTTATEIALARKLVKFPDAIRLAGDTLRPHYLCLYLFELASDYSSFNNADKVLVDDAAVRARRLLLCARTLLVLETGLQLLGLRTLTRM